MKFYKRIFLGFTGDMCLNNIRVLLVAFVVFMAQMCVAGPQPTPNPAKQKKANEIFKQALGQFNLGEMESALRTVNKSISTYPTPDAYSLQSMVHETLGDTASARKSYVNCIAVAPYYRPTYYYFADYLFRKRQFTAARAMLDTFRIIPTRKGYVESEHKASPKLIEKSEKLRIFIEAGLEDELMASEIHLENLGNRINSELNEYWPGMPFDGKTFVFTRMLMGQEDFYYSPISDSGFAKARPVPGNINTRENEGTLSISADGTSLYFSRCNQPGDFGSCEIYYSDLSDRGWTYGNNLGVPVNSAAWESQPAISGDGRVLIFSSNRPGGYGGKDLWITQLNRGKWSNPVNLGPQINTRENEESPFFHYDGKSLYFSSTGHPGYGGIDMYLSRLGEDGKWGAPVNMGSTINSADDDFGMYIDPSGRVGYIQSDRKGGFGGLDIYRFQLPKKFKPSAVTYVEGRVVDKLTGKPVAGKVQVVELKTGRIVFNDSVNRFFIPLLPGGNYAMHVNAKGYKLDSRNFQPEESSLDKPFKVLSELETYKANDIIVLKNIFFDTDKFDLKPESETEIKLLEDIMKANPTMVIEVRGHTDNQGNAAYNLDLSKNRALALVQSLVARGIAVNRFVAKGFGVTKPIATNETEEGRALNRRIEMVIVKP